MDFKKIWQVAKPHLIAIAIFLAVFAAYFNKQFEGMVVEQGDIVQGQGMTKELKDYHKRTGEYTLWTNSMFGGMPTYQIHSPEQSNLIRRIFNPLLSLFLGRPIGIFLLAAICFYIFMLVLDVNRWLAMIGSFSFSLATFNMVLFEAGHNTKLLAVAYLPLVLAGIYLILQKRRYWGGSVLLMIGISLNLSANHYQMTYYFFIGMLFFMLVYAVFEVLKGDPMHLVKSIGIMILAAALAVGPSYSKISTSLDYAKETMRGTSQLKKERLAKTSGVEDVKDVKEGLNWDYAMLWSNAPKDFLATFIPGGVGGSSQAEVGPDYPVAKFYGNGRTPIRAPLYFGGADSANGPAYFGVILAFLLVLGLLLLPNTGWKIGIVVALVIVMLLSLGRNFESFTRIFYEHFPKYNVFRAHNSAMTVATLFFPVLAIMGLSSFLNSKKTVAEKKRLILISAGVVGGICLIIAVMGSSLMDLNHFKDENIKRMFEGRQELYDQYMASLIESREQYMQASAWRSLIFVLLGAGILWIYVTAKKVNKTLIVAGIGVLVLIDLISVDWNYLNDKNFVSKARYEKPFEKRPIDEKIHQVETRGRGYYRVMDFSLNDPFSSSSTSFFHNTVGGYSPVKMQRIQDVIDSVIRQPRGVSYEVLDMLNTKYLITGPDQASPNPGALGPAWFVDSFKYVSSATEELYGIRDDFNSHTTAIIHNDFKDYMGGLQSHAVDSQAKRKIELIKYEPNKLVYETDCDKDEFAVFSEIWYGPDKGWKVTVDGEPVEHIRANYILRAMKVPAGKHEIIFEFDPDIFKKGERISMASSILILLLGLGWVYWYFFRRKDDEEKEPSQG